METYSNAERGQGGTRIINDRGSDGASYCKPPKIQEPESVYPINTYIKISYPKNTRLNTSILIYLIKQNSLMHDSASIGH